MSATLNGKADIIYNYTDAINAGGMVDYKVKIIDDDINSIMEVESKLIVYCATNARSKELYGNLISDNYDIYRIDCNTTAKNRLLIFKSFQNPKRKTIIFNCRVLGEGVDLPECDSIYFESGCTTYVTIIQAMGRCLRLSEKKKYGTIYMNIHDKNTNKRLNEMYKVDKKIYNKIVS